MFANPPDISQAGFLTILDRFILTLAGDFPYLGGSSPCAIRPGDPPEKIQADARLLIQVEGPQRYAISVRGKRTEFELGPGQCVYLAPNAWSIEFWGERGESFGMGILPHFLRLVQIRLPVIWLPNSTPWAYHTASPLGGGGILTCRALNYLAEEGGDADGARDLLVALLRFARQHLHNDDPAQPSHRRAQLTWQTVNAYMEENVSNPLTRESVAEAMDLHPNYLSALARQVAGQSFQQVLDSIRTQHAQRLLRDSDLKLDRIARLCGYSKGASLAKAFRRATGTTPGRFREAAIRPKSQKDDYQ